MVLGNAVVRVTVVGLGCVGLATATALNYVGHHVIGVDRDEELLENLQSEQPAIFEVSLSEAYKRAPFTTLPRLDATSASADVVLVVVDTPSHPDGSADVAKVLAVGEEVAGLVRDNADTVLVVKSTALPGTGEELQRVVDDILAQRESCAVVVVATNPEFVRQSSAFVDTLYPDRIVVGAEEASAHRRLREMYFPILGGEFNPPDSIPLASRSALPVLLEVSLAEAELIKYASNAFLATKLSFINEISWMAEDFGCDMRPIARGVGLDSRIGASYLEAGPGWGGPCLGKDARALIACAADLGRKLPVVTAAVAVNELQRRRMVERIKGNVGNLSAATIGVFGVAFKAGTDDVSDSPALAVISMLLEEGAHVRCYDPVANASAKRRHPQLAIQYHDSPVAMSMGCDALVVMTEWEEFRFLPWRDVALASPGLPIIDPRNCLDGKELKELGFNYMGG